MFVLVSANKNEETIWEVLFPLIYLGLPEVPSGTLVSLKFLHYVRHNWNSSDALYTVESIMYQRCYECLRSIPQTQITTNKNVYMNKFK